MIVTADGRATAAGGSAAVATSRPRTPGFHFGLGDAERVDDVGSGLAIRPGDPNRAAAGGQRLPLREADATARPWAGFAASWRASRAQERWRAQAAVMRSPGRPLATDPRPWGRRGPPASRLQMVFW